MAVEGYTAYLNTRKYPERSTYISESQLLVPNGTAYDGSANICAPRNWIVRFRTRVERYPSEFFLLAVRGMQGKNPPLHKFCAVGQIQGTNTDPFVLPALTASDPSQRHHLLYSELVSAFNKENQDVETHVFFRDLLEDVLEFNGCPFDETSLARDTASKEYLTLAKEEMKKFAQQKKARRERREATVTVETEQAAHAAQDKRAKTDADAAARGGSGGSSRQKGP